MFLERACASGSSPGCAASAAAPPLGIVAPAPATTCNSHTSSNTHRAAAAACLRASCRRYAGRTATRRVGSTHVSFPVREQVRGWPRRRRALGCPCEGGTTGGTALRSPSTCSSKPAPPRERRRHGALAVQQQPLQQPGGLSIHTGELSVHTSPHGRTALTTARELTTARASRHLIRPVACACAAASWCACADRILCTSLIGSNDV